MSILRKIISSYLHSASKTSEKREHNNNISSMMLPSTSRAVEDDDDYDNQVEYLPEECIARIISFTTVIDAACGMPLVSKMFKSAADSDEVWEGFLPSDIDEAVSELFPPSLSFSSRKELFVRLCQDPVLIDEGKKILALEKQTYKKCYMIAPRELMISWAENSHYWAWRSLPGSRFSEVAELLGVWWFDIRGRMLTKLLSPKTTYAIYLVFKLDNEERSQGFDGPVEVSMQLQTGLFESLQIPWEPQPRGNNSVWKEIQIGEFYNEQGDDGWVEMRLWEVESYKSGLFVQGIELRPKETRTPFA